ncbi:hypothetical protein ABZX85_39525 [Streptomyces sp. NPDC004539]|uniref:hypothetical protein n=1 Tax=Streptomyces sp. NPDC004539 TaxID=3154280 RepID=UPI0033ABFBA3
MTLIVQAASAQEAEEAALLLEDSDFGVADLARIGFRIDQLGFGDPEIEDLEPCDSPGDEPRQPSLFAPRAPSWTERLNRAETPGQLADVLEGAKDDAVGALHQFLEQVSEVFRESGDEPRAASFAAHAEALRRLSDELRYRAHDLRPIAHTARADAANITTSRAAATTATAEPVRSSVPPPRPSRSP